jgi:hypothetical protein
VALLNLLKKGLVQILQKLTDHFPSSVFVNSSVLIVQFTELYKKLVPNRLFLISNRISLEVSESGLVAFSADIIQNVSTTRQICFRLKHFLENLDGCLSYLVTLRPANIRVSVFDVW